MNANTVWLSNLLAVFETVLGFSLLLPLPETGFTLPVCDYSAPCFIAVAQ